MHTVELLPDQELDQAIRSIWERLSAAGLPSLARHPHPTNRPHLTVATAESLTGLPPLPLPLEAALGPARYLGKALVLPVTPTAGLRDLQAAVWSALDSWPPPGEWIPHLSLALNVPPPQRSAASALVADLPPLTGLLVTARTYDTVARVAQGIHC